MIKILVVEDNPITRKMLRVALKAEGYEVMDAADGRTGLELAKTCPPDLVLQDLNLPDGSGVDLSSRFRDASGNPELPVIAVSGDLPLMDRIRHENGEFTDFLAKPVEPSHLVEVIRAYLTRRGLETQSPGRGKRVLIVEDTDAQRKLLRICLENLGFEVETAADGLEALEKIRASVPDAVISDILMPRVDGFQLCQALREDRRLERVPILLVSSVYTDREDRELAEALGATALIVRSEGLEAITARLRSSLEGGEAGDPVGASAEQRAEYELSEKVERLQQRMMDQERRQSVLRTSLGILTNLPEIMSGSLSTASLIQDLLPRFIDAAGLSCGAAYLRGSDGRLLLEAHYGFAGMAQAGLPDLFGFPELLDRVQAEGHPLSISAACAGPLDRLLERARLSSIILTPLTSAKEILGVLVIGSKREEIAEEWTSISGALGTQVGQILGLSRALAQIRLAESRCMTLVDRTKSLEEQIRQVQKMEAVGRLAGGVAHDFNNLLTVINGLSEIACGRIPKTDPLRGDMEEIFQAGQKAACLTRQLLAFSRRQIVQPRAFDLNGIVRDMEKMLRRLVGEDVELSLHLSVEPAIIKADRGQIEQVLMNLVVNARDAMPKGGRIFIRTSSEAEGFRLEVQDTGVGMERSVREHLFEPFFTTKGPGKGTGLGLSTVYGIVQQSGGTIRVDSEPGRGTTFFLTFPEAVGGPPSEAKLAASAAAPPTGATVLLAEDESSVRMLAKTLLERAGFRVLEAANGEEALTLAGGAGRIDLLLTDIVMPKLGGTELADRLAKTRPEVPVVYMSGYAGPMLDDRFNGPASALLEKPFSSKTLLEKVRGALVPSSPEASSLSFLRSSVM